MGSDQVANIIRRAGDEVRLVIARDMVEPAPAVQEPVCDKWFSTCVISVYINHFHLFLYHLLISLWNNNKVKPIKSLAGKTKKKYMWAGVISN